MTDQELAVNWMFEGEIGTSSETLCRAFLMRSPGKHEGLPSDTDDLARCRLFIEMLSEECQEEALRLVAIRYPDWKPLVREWDSVCAMMDEDCPNWRNGGKRWSDKAYKRMGVLRVEGLRLLYPNASIQTRPDGTLSSMNVPDGPMVIVMGGEK